MKKILSLLGAIGLISSTSVTSVMSCSLPNPFAIKITSTDPNFSYLLGKATTTLITGTKQTYYINDKLLSNLNNDLSADEEPNTHGIKYKTKGDNFDHYFDMQIAPDHKSFTLESKYRTPISKDHFEIIISKSGLGDAEFVLYSRNPKIDISEKGKFRDICKFTNRTVDDICYVNLENSFNEYYKQFIRQDDPEDIKRFYGLNSDFFMYAYTDMYGQDEVNIRNQQNTSFTDLDIKLIEIRADNKNGILTSDYFTGVAKFHMPYDY